MIEVVIVNHAKLQSRKTVVRAESLSENATTILVTSDQREGLCNHEFWNPFFARARALEIRTLLE